MLRLKDVGISSWEFSPYKKKKKIFRGLEIMFLAIRFIHSVKCHLQSAINGICTAADTVIYCWCSKICKAMVWERFSRFLEGVPLEKYRNQYKERAFHNDVEGSILMVEMSPDKILNVFAPLPQKMMTRD